MTQFRTTRWGDFEHRDHSYCTIPLQYESERERLIRQYR